MTEITGRCLCGALAYRTEGPPNWTALCHCESCRRACSSPVVAWMGFDVGTVHFQGDQSVYHSSDIGKRGFCPKCGTQMSFESTRWPGEIHLYAVSMDDPSSYVPELHCHHAERLAWLHLQDDLPKHHGSAPS